jgi:hypothetical protein
MRKLITGAIVAAALAVPATPAFAIHHGTHLGDFVPECAQSDNALGGNGVAGDHANTGNSNTPDGGLSHNDASPNCLGLR